MFPTRSTRILATSQDSSFSNSRRFGYVIRFDGNGAFLVEELNCEMFIVGASNLKGEAAGGDAFGLQIEIDKSALTVALSCSFIMACDKRRASPPE